MDKKSLLLVIILGVAGGILLSGILVAGAYWTYLTYQKWVATRLAYLQMSQELEELARKEELSKRPLIDCPKLIKMSPGELVKEVDGPPVIQANKNSSTVVFFRPSSALQSDAMFYFISENGRNIGGLKPGSYFTIQTTPGEHIYTTAPVSPANVENIKIKVTANETTYIMGAKSPMYGGWCGLPHLVISNHLEFKESESELTYLELTEKGKTYN